MKTKVKVSTVTESDLKKTGEIRLRQAKALFQSFPIATKTWMAMRGYPMGWLQENWNEITDLKSYSK